MRILTEPFVLAGNSPLIILLKGANLEAIVAS